MARWRGHRRCLVSTTPSPVDASNRRTRSALVADMSREKKAAQQRAAAEAAEEEPTALTPTVAKPTAKAARERLCIRRRLRLQLRDSTPKSISWAVPWSRPGARYAYGCDTGEPCIPDAVIECCVEPGDSGIVLGVVRSWLARGGSTSSRLKFEADATLLHLCSRAGHATSVAHLLSCGAAPNALDGGGSTALGLACDYCHEDVVRELLHRGADPNAGATPLRQAPMNGDVEVCRTLLGAGARHRAICSQTGMTALMVASAGGGADAELVGFGELIKHRLARLLERGRSPDYQGIVDLLLEVGAAVDTQVLLLRLTTPSLLASPRPSLLCLPRAGCSGHHCTLPCCEQRQPSRSGSASSSGRERRPRAAQRSKSPHVRMHWAG